MAQRKFLFTNSNYVNEESSATDDLTIASLTVGGITLSSTGFNVAVPGISPTLPGHIATKSYVDGISGGFDFKNSVVVASTGPLTLSGTQTIDGIGVLAGERVLVKDQAAPETNGIYTVAAGAWSRSTDADTIDEINAGMFVIVEDGSVNADTAWLQTESPAVLGTDALQFAQFDPGVIQAGDGLLKTGYTLDVVSANAAIVVGADDLALTLDGAEDFTGGGSGLDITASGLRLADLNENNILIGNPSNRPIAAAVSGDLSVDGGAFTVFAVSATYTSGAALAAGDAVYVSANNEATKYVVTNGAQRPIGVCTTTTFGGAGEPVRIVKSGLAAGVLAGATAGTPIYHTASGLSATAPSAGGSHVWEVGTAKNATDLEVAIRFVKKNS